MRTLFALCVAAASALAQVEVRDGILFLSTPELELSFEGLNVRNLRNLRAGETYIAFPGPGWLDLNLREPTGESLRAGTWSVTTDGETGRTMGQIRATDAARTVTLQVGIDGTEVFFRVNASSTKPGVRAVLWGMQGFDGGGQFVFPGQAGIVFNSNSPRERLALEYPTHWEAQFAVYEGKQGGLLLYARDPKPHFKRVQASRELGTLDIAFEIFAKAPWPAATEVPAVEWRLKSLAKGWREGTDHYRAWADTALPSAPKRPELAWVDEIQAVIVIVDGQDSYIQRLAEKLIPEKTLLYLVNWRQDPYDVNYPNYLPAPGVAEFVAKAKEKGFRVMIHTSALGVAQYNEAYELLKQYQLRQPDDESLIFWPFGLWPGGAPPPDYLPSFAFISPAAAAYRKMYTEAVGAAIERVKPDAVHMDAGGVLLNDANGDIEGRNSIEGMIELHRDMATKFPHIALSYESITETLAPFQNFAQRWNSDFESHPIGTYLLGDRVRFYGFLDQENPDEPGFLRYIRRYESQGIMPTLRIHSLEDLSDDKPVASRILRLMRLFQEHQFRPDWDGDWTGKQFRFLSKDGTTEALVEDLGERVKVTVAGEVIYERVRRASSIETPLAIDNWPAYNGERLLGLDPEQEYWLGLHEKDGVERPTLESVPADARIGEATLVTPEYGLFELRPVQRPGFDFVSNFRNAKLGVLYGARDLPLAGGAVTLMTRTLVGGSLQTPAVVVLPASRLSNSATFFEYSVPVPDAADVRLQFEVGLSDFGRRSDGALVAVWIDGVSQWRQEIRLGAALPVNIDLAQWKGKTVRLRLLTHAGPRFNALDDVVSWSNLRLAIAARTTGEATVRLPASAETPQVTGQSVRSALEGGRLKIEGQLPSLFAVFTRTPREVKVGDRLIELPRDTWELGYGGYIRPALPSARDDIYPVISGGERIETALAMIPPTKGVRLVTYAVRLPENVKELVFRVGLADPSPPLPPVIDYSAAELRVKINGELIWSQQLRLAGWNWARADLTKWAGQNVIVQLETDSLSNAIYDWVYWDSLRID